MNEDRTARPTGWAGFTRISSRWSTIAAAALLIWLCAVSTGNARTALEARKELASIGAEFKRSVFIESAKESDAVAIELFLEAGMNPTVTDPDGKTVLTWAAIENHVKILKLLAAAKVNLNGSGNDPYRRTPLHWAVTANSVDAVRFLAQAGADLNALDNQGDNALLHAVKRNHGKVTEILLDAGMDVNALDPNGLPPIMWATLRGWTEGFELLRKAGADLTARIRNTTTVTDANTGGWYTIGDNSSILTMAASRGHSGIVTKLLEAAASSDTDDRVVALTQAAANGHGEVVKILVAARVPVNGRDTRERTALFYAARKGEADVVRDLLAAGANHQMDVALTNAIRAGFTPVVKLLMEAGAYADVGLDDWRNVVGVARERGNTDIVEILKSSRSGLTPDHREPTAPNIRHFQGCLQAFGYDPGTMDGVLGDMTVKALELFQGNSRLPKTGSLDQATRDALMDKGCPRVAALNER